MLQERFASVDIERLASSIRFQTQRFQTLIAQLETAELNLPLARETLRSLEEDLLRVPTAGRC